MTYRDDHDAAVARADALERELALVKRQRGEVERGARFDWNGVFGATASGAFTTVALWMGWSTWFAGGGFVLFAITVIALLSGGASKSSPTGAVPVTIELGERRLIAVVRMHTSGDPGKKAAELYAARDPDDVAAAAKVVLEPILREGKEGEVALAVARERLAPIGLQVEALWAGRVGAEPG